ncbi:putative HSF-type DNA-binding [Phytophthora cinnamomi]|nr:putative HSF-type DNA-binding [Phytophthora cinnamomi]
MAVSPPTNVMAEAYVPQLDQVPMPAPQPRQPQPNMMLDSVPKIQNQRTREMSLMEWTESYGMDYLLNDSGRQMPLFSEDMLNYD